MSFATISRSKSMAAAMTASITNATSYINALNRNPTFHRLDLSGEHFNGCGLPRPVGSQESQDLLLGHLKDNMINGRQLTVTAGEMSSKDCIF
jgi:hypothetical protein